jgi:hypothetical protein
MGVGYGCSPSGRTSAVDRVVGAKTVWDTRDWLGNR